MRISFVDEDPNVSLELKKLTEEEKGSNTLERKVFLLFSTIKNEIRSNHLIIIFMGIGILISLVRMLVDGVGYSNDEYDVYADYFRGLLQNNLTVEQESWFIRYRWKNRVLYPLILSITSLITTLEPIIVAIPLGILFFMLSIIIIVQILKERGNTQKEINLIVSPFAVSPGLLPHMVRPTTDHLFMFLILIVLLFFIRFMKRVNYWDLIFGIFFSLLTIITREFGFLLIFILPILFIVKWVEEKRYLLILGFSISIIISVFSLIQILNFTPSFIINLFFWGDVSETIISGKISLNDIFQILYVIFIEKWTRREFFRTYTLIESMVYTILVPLILSLFGVLSWDNEKKFQESKNVKRSVLVIWFMLGLFSLMILQSGRIQARYWMPIMIIPYLEIPSGINHFQEKFQGKFSENLIFSLLIIFQIAISLIRIIFTSMNIGLEDLILAFS